MIINGHFSSCPNHGKGDIETQTALQAADSALANGSDDAFVVGDWNQSGVDSQNIWGTLSVDRHGKNVLNDLGQPKRVDRIKDIDSDDEKQTIDDSFQSIKYSTNRKRRVS